MLNPCPHCKTEHSKNGDNGPQLFGISQILRTQNLDEAYTTEYCIRCLWCGLEVYDEYLEDLLQKWNSK